MEIFNNWNNTEHWFFLLWVWIACFFICRIPFVGIWFRTFDTLMHETGHALVAFVLNGKVEKIELNSNLGGKTVYKSKRNILIDSQQFKMDPHLLFIGENKLNDNNKEIIQRLYYNLICTIYGKKTYKLFELLYF
jgi:hypothetical protein